MLIVFGWEKTSKPVESVLKTNCYNCQNKSGWTIWKETEGVSLFFVKVIPFITKYYLCCNLCYDSVPLSAKDARACLNPKKRTRELHDHILGLIDQHQFSGLTENQIKFRKSQFEDR